MQLTKTATEVVHSLNLDDTSFLDGGLITDSTVLSDLLRKLLEASESKADNSDLNYLYFVPDNVSEQGKYLNQFYKVLTQDNFALIAYLDCLENIRKNLSNLVSLLISALKGTRTFKSPYSFLYDPITSLYRETLSYILKINREKIDSDDNVNLVSFCFISAIYNLKLLLRDFHKSFFNSNTEWEKSFNSLLEDLKLYWFLF